MSSPEREVCPACGGAGGGPFGRANSGWDVESYECARCQGWGYIREAVRADEDVAGSLPRPGIAKTVPDRAAVEEAKRKASTG